MGEKFVLGQKKSDIFLTFRKKGLEYLVHFPYFDTISLSRPS